MVLYPKRGAGAEETGTATAGKDAVLVCPSLDMKSTTLKSAYLSIKEGLYQQASKHYSDFENDVSACRGGMEV